MGGGGGGGGSSTPFKFMRCVTYISAKILASFKEVLLKNEHAKIPLHVSDIIEYGERQTL